jgi:NTE family protein
MSSGFFGFFAHAGVLRVLEDEGLLPDSASGSSAGALVTGLWASGLSSRDVARELVEVSRRDFWDPALGPGFLRGRLFRQRLEAQLAVRTFAECRIPVAMSVFDMASRETHVLEHGELAPAIQASCTVPFLFHPVRHHGRAFLDGGILDRPGLAGVKRRRVLHHHLPSRSPWRAFVDVPRRDGLVALVIDNLPRSGPFRLKAGHRALDVATRAARTALDRVVSDGLVRVT